MAMRRVNKDRFFHHARLTDSLKIPMYRSLTQVGDEPGMEGDIILESSTGRLCYHDESSWVCVSSGGSPLEVQDETNPVDLNTVVLNFTGAGVTAASGVAGVVNVTIPGGGGGSVTSVDGLNVGTGSGEVFRDTTIAGTDYTLNLRRLTSVSGGGAEGSGGLTITTDTIADTVNLQVNSTPEVNVINVGEGADIYNDSPPTNPIEIRTLQGAPNLGTPGNIEAEDVVINDTVLIQAGLNPVVDGNRVGVPVLNDLEIFVDPTGNNDLDGLTPGTAVRTVSRAFEILRFRGYGNNAQINLAAGDYDLLEGSPNVDTITMKCGHRGQERGEVVLRGALSEVKNGTILNVTADPFDNLRTIQGAAAAFTADDEGRVIEITNGPQVARYILGNRTVTRFDPPNDLINVCSSDGAIIVPGATYRILERTSKLLISSSMKMVGDNSPLYFVDLIFEVDDLNPINLGIPITLVIMQQLSAIYVNVEFSENGMLPISPVEDGLILFALIDSSFGTLSSISSAQTIVPESLATAGPAGVAIRVPLDFTPPILSDRTMSFTSDSRISFDSSFTVGFDKTSTVILSSTAELGAVDSIFTTNSNTCLRGSKSIKLENVRGVGVQELVEMTGGEFEISNVSLVTTGIGSTAFILKSCTGSIRNVLVDGNNNAYETVLFLDNSKIDIDVCTFQNLATQGSRVIDATRSSVIMSGCIINGVTTPGNVTPAAGNSIMSFIESNLTLSQDDSIINWNQTGGDVSVGIFCDRCNVNIRGLPNLPMFVPNNSTAVHSLLYFLHSAGTVSTVEVSNTSIIPARTAITIENSNMTLREIGTDLADTNFGNSMLELFNSDVYLENVELQGQGNPQNVLFAQSCNLYSSGELHLTGSSDNVVELRRCTFDISGLRITNDNSPVMGGDGFRASDSQGILTNPNITNVISDDNARGDGISIINSQLTITKNDNPSVVSQCSGNGIYALSSILYVNGEPSAGIQSNLGHGILLESSRATIRSAFIDLNGSNSGSPPDKDGIHAIGSTFRCINCTGSSNENYGIYLGGGSHVSGLAGTNTHGVVGDLRVGSLVGAVAYGNLNAFDYGGSGSGLSNEDCSAVRE